MNNIKIEQFEILDIEAVAALLRLDWELHAKNTPIYSMDVISGRDIKAWIEDRVVKQKSFAILSAKVDNVIAGVLLFRTEDNPSIHIHPRQLVIEDVVVTEEFRRMGVASALIKACEEFALKQKIEQVTGYIYTFNDPSRQLFTREGYTNEYSAFVKFLDKQVLHKPAPKKHIQEIKIFADGGSRGNPGPSAGGFAILDMADNILKKSGKYLGITTNNQAEYHSLKGAIEAAKAMNAHKVHVFMDSLLVVNQMKGIYKIRNRDLWPIHQAIKELLGSFKEIEFVHVPREMNKLADSIVNETLDSQKS